MKSMPVFNVLAMNDVKDKTTKTKKVGLRPLLDCVVSIEEAALDLKDFLQSNGETQEIEIVTKCLQQLTDMQVELLQVCQGKAQAQAEIAPVQPTVPEETKIKLGPVEKPREGVVG